MFSVFNGSEQKSDLTDAQHHFMDCDRELFTLSRELFTGPDVVQRLRQASGLRRSDTPEYNTWDEFRQYTWSCFGVAAEVLALTLWHLAAEKGWSGRKVERYRDAAEFAWKYKWGDECDDGIFSWHKGDDGLWEGNPATAPIVFRAVDEAYYLHGQRRLARASRHAPARASDPDVVSSSQS